MSEKRRDKKGRLLRTGEYQRKDGKYEYKYTDIDGSRRSIYSWRLVSTDKTPDGKKQEISLRELEADIIKDLEDGIRSGKDIVFSECFKNYIDRKRKIKPTTRSYYCSIYKRYIEPTFGNRVVNTIDCNRVKRLYEEILYDKKLSMETLKTVHVILREIFQQLCDDRYLKTNPSEKAFRDIKSEYGNQKPSSRISLTEDQQNAFLDFLSTYHNQRFNDMVIVLLGTGCRISEIIGLTWDDCDFEKEIISINHNIAHCKIGEGKKKFIIISPKTYSGIRNIPMLNMVKEALLRTKLRNSEQWSEDKIIEVDGYKDFVFLNRNGNLYTTNSVYRLFEHAIKAYNNKARIDIVEDNHTPALLPMFSAHNLRHTFCTRFCENEANLKVIQSVMGHSNISVTMNVYNHATLEKVEQSMKKMNDVFDYNVSTTNFTTND